MLKCKNVILLTILLLLTITGCSQKGDVKSLHKKFNREDIQLLNAIGSDNENEIIVALKNKANPNVKTEGESMTPLMLEAIKGNIAIMKQLMDYKADINLTDIRGMTALHWAADQGQREAVKFLIEHGANSNLRDKENDMPIDKAKSHLNNNRSTYQPIVELFQKEQKYHVK